MRHADTATAAAAAIAAVEVHTFVLCAREDDILENCDQMPLYLLLVTGCTDGGLRLTLLQLPLLLLLRFTFIL